MRPRRSGEHLDCGVGWSVAVDGRTGKDGAGVRECADGVISCDAAAVRVMNGHSVVAVCDIGDHCIQNESGILLGEKR